MAPESKKGTLGNLVFLSYRRADTAPHTLALRLELETRLRAIQIFMDTHVIQAGDAWPSQIEDALHTAKAIVPVIGKSWEGASEGEGRRIDDPDDWVHREIKFALDHKRDAVVPVLIDGTSVRHPEQLPPPLRELASIQPFSIDINNWHNDVDSFVKFLRGKFSFEGKRTRYKFPTPDPIKERTIPYPWNDLESVVLKHLRAWRIEFTDDPDKLHYKRVELTRDFEFKSFTRAMEFINLASQHAVEVDHNPRWMNVWKTVTVWLSTWDAGHRITVSDIEFARYLERKYKEF
jgi:pterin-4a-carbinolamine dehydratase